MKSMKEIVATAIAKLKSSGTTYEGGGKPVGYVPFWGNGRSRMQRPNVRKTKARQRRRTHYRRMRGKA